ncbi:MAG: hypothetical protein AAEJ59_02305 [Arenicellales bacterium]
MIDSVNRKSGSAIHFFRHLNYESTIVRIKDVLARFKDFLSDLGGSGEILPE